MDRRSEGRDRRGRPGSRAAAELTPDAEQLWTLVRQDEPLGPFGRSAIAAGDDVGRVDGDGTSQEAQERRANGLCS